MAKRSPNKKIQTPQERIDHFKQYGYDCLIVWERELKDMDKVIRKIKTFTETGVINHILAEMTNNLDLPDGMPSRTSEDVVITEVFE